VAARSAPLRKHFPRTKGGNEQIAIIESLDTGDLAVARRKRDELAVAYRRVFDRLSAGEPMTQEQIKAAVTIDLPAEMRTFTGRRWTHIARGSRLSVLP
jgi:hypothetical protein